jgi:ribosomal protein L22
MGQKTHPYGFRLGVIKTWSSKWYENGSSYTKWLHEDIRIKRAIKQYLYNANIAGVEIERAANRAKVIESAVANAQKDGADVDALFVSKAAVDKGPNKFNRRWRPRAMGRATRVQKGISHIVIELSERK